MNDKIDIELAEDEDLARAKAWWKENGSSIIGGVLIGTVVVFGYKYWQIYQGKTMRTKLPNCMKNIVKHPRTVLRWIHY